jgi:hypothetical protein
MVYNRNEAENEEYGGRNAAITAEHSLSANIVGALKCIDPVIKWL